MNIEFLKLAFIIHCLIVIVMYLFFRNKVVKYIDTSIFGEDVIKIAVVFILFLFAETLLIIKIAKEIKTWGIIIFAKVVLWKMKRKYNIK